MNVSFTGGTAQQRQWVQDAISTCNFPFDGLSVSVEFTWGTPPVANHSAFACTVSNGGGSYTVTLRPDLDDPNRDPLYNGKSFYEETVVHELGHVAQMALADSSAQHDSFCDMFGAPHTDWTISEATPQGWETAVVEAVAETFKDMWFPDRKFDNRTRWKLASNETGAFAAMFPVTGAATIIWQTGEFGIG